MPLGQVDLPLPLAEVAGRTRDDMNGGRAHKGLACAASLARAGRSAPVLEHPSRLLHSELTYRREHLF